MLRWHTRPFDGPHSHRTLRGSVQHLHSLRLSRVDDIPPISRHSSSMSVSQGLSLDTITRFGVPYQDFVFNCSSRLILTWSPSGLVLFEDSSDGGPHVTRLIFNTYMHHVMVTWEITGCILHIGISFSILACTYGYYACTDS